MKGYDGKRSNGSVLPVVLPFALLFAVRLALFAPFFILAGGFCLQKGISRMKKRKLRRLTRTALIAAIYTLLTMLLLPLSFASKGISPSEYTIISLAGAGNAGAFTASWGMFRSTISIITSLQPSSDKAQRS